MVPFLLLLIVKEFFNIKFNTKICNFIKILSLFLSINKQKGFLVNRGLKTLAIRMREHMANGLKVAKALANNPRVLKVIYPGLESHPQHELYKKQMKGFGGMIAIYINGDLDAACTFMKSLKVNYFFE